MPARHLNSADADERCQQVSTPGRLEGLRQGQANQCWLAGCGPAAMKFDSPKTESTAIKASTDAYFDTVFTDLGTIQPGESGFHLLSDGIEALAARLLIASRVERTLDVQYYLITNDPIGFAFIGALLQAADRGVRVRLLLDDIQTQGYDAGMAALDSHPNFEVRIFNPFAGRGVRASNFADFGRINRRMHNKSFTGDNRITIIGGRNIAAEYFSAREDVNFGDVDVAGIGPVVTDVSTMFDSYWNHRSALPVPAFAKMPDDPAAALVELRARIEENVNNLRKTAYAEAFRESVGNLEALGLDDYFYAPYEVVYDSPDKSDKTLAADAASIVTPLKKSIDGAKSELIIISPYFVPLKSGIEYLTDLQARGVQVRVITNSLAAPEVLAQALIEAASPRESCLV